MLSVTSKPPDSASGSKSSARCRRIAGRWRSAAGGVNAGWTSLRSRRWFSPSRSSRFPWRRSWIGPSFTPCASSNRVPGKVAFGVRRKNAAASRSNTKNPTGSARANQPRSRASPIASWNGPPTSLGSL